MKESVISRRMALKKVGLFGVMGSAVVSSVARAASQIATPAQTEGPFYPIKDQVDKDADMTRVRGRLKEAQGDRIEIAGTLLNAESARPIEGALVEFWQACASGRYNHPRDPNTSAPMDPDFQYWAQVRTDDRGRFSVKTIKPGAYPADDTWMRPPHIHVKVHKAGYPSLTTQLYFSGEPLNDKDDILQALPAAKQKLVIVDLVNNDQTNVGAAAWTIYLTKFAGLTQTDLATPELD